MEDRLPLLIQKRLEAEIQRHPPLFPWETEVDEYDESEAADIDIVRSCRLEEHRDSSLQSRQIHHISSPNPDRVDNDT